MTEDRTVQWNGNTYFTDPAELTMGEFEVLGQRSDVTGLVDLTDRIGRTDHIGWKALFWLQDRRRTPDLRWDGYDGPTMRTIFDAAKAWPKAEADEEPGKAPTVGDGSAPSPTSSDTPPTSSTP